MRLIVGLWAVCLAANLAAAEKDKTTADAAVKQKLSDAFASLEEDQRKWEKEQGGKAEYKLDKERKALKKEREKAEKEREKEEKDRKKKNKDKDKDGDDKAVYIDRDSLRVKGPRAVEGEGAWFEVGGVTTGSRSSSSGIGSSSSSRSGGGTSIGVRTTVIDLSRGPDE